MKGGEGEAAKGRGSFGGGRRAQVRGPQRERGKGAREEGATALACC